MRIGFLNREDITLGTLAPPLPFPRLRLSPKHQQYHATIWGKTGSGKSRLLQSLFVQHAAKSHGVGLLEPQNDLSLDTLASLISHGFFRREDAFNKLIYLDWGNGFVPFNILADDGRTDAKTRALDALDAMLRVWPELNDAPLFKRLFLSSMSVLIANNLPITFLYQLLANNDFRARCLQKVEEPLVQQVFETFDALGRDQMQAAGSTLNRAFQLSYSPSVGLTLGQPENWLDFRRIMDEGKAIIINLGNVGDHETRKLLGAILMVQIERAALSRTNVLPHQRRAFTLLVDEWPSFAANEETIGTILSQARKFNLRLYLAAQSLSEISSKRLAGALENCRLTVVFGVGRGSAEISAQEIGEADPFAIKEAPLTETQHGQYLTILEQFETWTKELQTLSPRTAYVKLGDAPAVKIKTPTVPDAKADPRELARVMGEYTRRYQRSREEAEAAITRISHPNVQSYDQETARPAHKSLFNPAELSRRRFQTNGIFS